MGYEPSIFKVTSIRYPYVCEYLTLNTMYDNPSNFYKLNEPLSGSTLHHYIKFGFIQV